MSQLKYQEDVEHDIPQRQMGSQYQVGPSTALHGGEQPGTARSNFPWLAPRGSYKWNYGVVVFGCAMNQFRLMERVYTSM